MLLSLLIFLSFFSFLAIPTFAIPATLEDLWNGDAHFVNEERVRFPVNTYNSDLDFYYESHDTGMTIIQDPNSPNIVYYIGNQWKNGDYSTLEPVIYKSTDAGLTFTTKTKIFDVLGADQNTCPDNGTYAYWDYGKKYCLFQMREPDVIFYNNYYYILYEAVAKSNDGEVIMGPALVKLSSLNITSPLQIVHGQNFRQNPLIIASDGNPDQPGDQVTSISTPFWGVDGDKLYVFWAGIYNLEQWIRQDVYRGHFSSQPNSPLVDCSDPIYCFFTPDQYYITNPNLAINPDVIWEKEYINGHSVVKENDNFYMLYGGSDKVDPTNNSRWSSLAIAKSTNLENWQRKNTAQDQIMLLDKTDGIHKFGLYGKLAKINGDYYLYYLMGSHLPGQTDFIARTYRMKLTLDNPDPNCTPPTSATINNLVAWYSDYRSQAFSIDADLNCDNSVNTTDLIFWYNLYRQ